MQPPPIPPDEADRLKDLRRLDMLLAAPEEVYDRVTQELARIFEVHSAMMTFIDRDTQYYKSAVGLPPELAATRTEPRELSVCSFVIGENRMLVVEDLLSDERFRDNPMVLASGARFYAGAPLRTEGGRAIGTLCLVDVQPRAFGQRECELLRLVAEGVMAQIRLQAASRQLLQRTKQIERDLEQAVQMQRFLLPPARREGDGWRVSHLYRPYEHLGGDFVDVHEKSDGRLAILVADVSGHGTSAAMTVAMTKTALHRAAPTIDRPAQLLTSLNRELSGLVPPSQFMTALAAILHPTGHVVTIASAGHPYPLLIHGESVQVVSHDNEPPLLLSGARRYARETALELPPGDRLLAYTDGAFEAAAPDGGRLDIAGLAGQVREVAGDDRGAFLEGLMARLNRRAQGGFNDDVALLCIESLQRTQPRAPEVQVTEKARRHEGDPICDESQMGSQGTEARSAPDRMPSG